MRALPMALGRRALLWWTLVFSIVAGVVAVSNESLWIDEANSALKSMQPSLASWWGMLVSEKGSDLQMPLYMFQLWAWDKLFGHTEFVLRSLNIVWFCIGQLALAWALRRRPSQAWLVMLLGASSPIIWYYLNDARPYLMQYGAACLLGAALLRAAEDPGEALRPGALWIFGAGLVTLCGSSLLGVVWAVGAVGAWFCLLSGQSKRHFRNLLPVITSTICLALLGAYYWWTMKLGTGASAAGNTGLLNLAFIGYELLGVAGLGPGRLQIREHGFDAFRDSAIFLCLPAIAGLLSAGLLIFGARVAVRRFDLRITIAALIYAVPPAAILLAVGYSQNFRLLGRHFMPLVPLVLGVFAVGISQLWQTRRLLGGGALAALMLAWLSSSLSLRFDERHRKDDYRTAAQVAKAALARDEIVWWSADRAAAIYYGVPINPTPKKFDVVLIFRPSREDLARFAPPDTVIASKPDIYDGRSDALAGYLPTHQFIPVRDLPAFTIWRKAAGPSEVR